MSPVPACTIASNNYLAFARVFAESYLSHHPGARVFACIVDTPHPAVDYEALPFTPVFAHQLAIPGFHNFAFRYDVLELNTAVKPYLLSHLRDRFGLDRVFYFDPDILVCDRLTGLAEALAENSAVLTPHITRPLEDGHHPSDRMIRQRGTYNLGFLGLCLDQRTAEFLDWWQDRLYRLCLVDPGGGLFVDQSWMDLAPALLDSVAIARDPIYNVAYWNLPHRRVTIEAGRWLADGSPIGFFHFSGIDLEDLEAVSRHQDRLTLSERPELRPCFEHYRRLLLAAGDEELRELPYAYGAFLGSEVEIPAAARRALLRIDPLGRRWPNPFESRGDDTFHRWLFEPLELEDGYLHRLALALWDEQSELRLRFPRVLGENLGHYLDWLEGEVARGELEPLILEGLARKPRPTLRELFDRTLLPEAPESPGETLLLGLIHDLLPLDQPAGLRDWLHQPVAETGRRQPLLTRLAMMLYGVREDARKAFPDPLGEHQLDVANWFVTHARQGFRLPPEVVEPVASTLPPEVRRTTEEAWGRKRAELLGALLAAGAPAALAAWLAEPVPEAGDGPPALTRLAMLLYELRADIRAACPDPLGRDRLALARWFVDSARRQYRLPAAMVEPVASTLPSEPGASAAERRAAKGVETLANLAEIDRMKELRRWLNQPPDGAGEWPRITRLAIALHAARGDLQAAFPDPLGGDRAGFARWFAERAGEEHRLPASLVAAVEQSLASPAEGASPVESREPAAPIPPPARAGRGAPARGVNLAGHFDAATGVGQMGRASAAALHHAGIPFVRVPLDQEHLEKTIRETIHQPEGLPFAVTLLNSNADETPYALRTLPLAAMVEGYKIGYWYWELAHFPLTFADRFDLLDEVWAASRFARRAFEAIATLPVRWVPPFVPAPANAPVERSRLGLEDGRFVFFYAFDAGSVAERKNPQAAIEAIRRLALASARPVGLLLKVSRPELDPELLPRLQRRAEGLPVVFFTRRASRELMEGMLASCDAILSLHRSEGLGLLPIEGLYLGKPVVATAYGGVTDFLDQSTGFPVDFKLRALDRDLDPYPRGSVWADPHVEHAVEQMLRLVEHPEEARARAAEGRRRVTDLYGLEAASRRLASELERVFELVRERS